VKKFIVNKKCPKRKPLMFESYNLMDSIEGIAVIN
jgi:hypothetical protein